MKNGDNMDDINRVIIRGRLGDAPELRNLATGGRVAVFSVATNERYESNGEQREVTQWHRITAWNSVADAAMLLQQGQTCIVEAQLRYRSWEQEDGTKRYATDLVAGAVFALSPPRKRRPQPTDQRDEDPNF